MPQCWGTVLSLWRRTWNRLVMLLGPSPEPSHCWGFWVPGTLWRLWPRGLPGPSLTLQRKPLLGPPRSIGQSTDLGDWWWQGARLFSPCLLSLPEFLFQTQELQVVWTIETTSLVCPAQESGCSSGSPACTGAKTFPQWRRVPH